MKLSAFKNNVPAAEVDFSAEVTSQAEAFFLIGRADSCHLVLDDKQVSREHAQISFENNKWSISQLTQFGVVIINGMAMPQKELANGDMIMIGPFMVMVSQVDQEVVVSSPVEEAEDENATETQMVDPEPEALELETEESQKEESEEFNVAPEEEVDEDSFIREEEPESSEEESSDQEFGEGDFNSDDDTVEENQDFSNEETSADGDFGGGDDDGFGDDDGGFDDGMGDDDGGGFDDDEGTKVLQSFARFELIIEGEYAPYDRYVVENGKTVVGRDPKKCQIILNDPEVSGSHAEIDKNNILCTLKDLQSGNGTILNGSRINQIELTNGDEFIIGSTTFTVAVASDLLSQEQDRLMPVEEDQVIEVEEEVEVGADFGEGGDFGDDDEEGGLADFGDSGEIEAPKSLVGKFKVAWKDPAKRKKIIYGIVGLTMAWVFLGESDPPPKKEKAKTTKEKAAKDKAAQAKKLKTKKNHSPETLQQLEARYMLANKHVEAGNYEQALAELDYIAAIDEDYKNTRALMKHAKAGFNQLEELERKRREEEQRKIRQAKIKDLVEEAKKATTEKNVPRAEALFGQILEMDPENFDVPTLRNELDGWKKEQERIALEKAQKEADRKRKLSQIAPGKKYYLQKEWHKAILKLEDFLDINDMDEDLVKEATTMLKEAKKELDGEIAPRLGRARSLREGKDDKGAYAQYKEILKVDPTNREALDEMNEIMESLTKRARRVYRDALISESLSLFDEAKEKFNEVKQISPTDGEYYHKAEERLKDYLE